MPEAKKRLPGDAGKLQALFGRQDPTGIKTHDWDDLTPRVTTDNEGKIVLACEDVEVGFVFNADGRLEGAFNWKE